MTWPKRLKFFVAIPDEGMGPEGCSATKNCVDLNSAVGFRTSLGFQQGFCFFNRLPRSGLSCVADMRSGLGDKHRRRSRRFAGKFPTQEQSGLLALCCRKTAGPLFRGMIQSIL